jgi:hypothetical protein
MAHEGLFQFLGRELRSDLNPLGAVLRAYFLSSAGIGFRVKEKYWRKTPGSRSNVQPAAKSSQSRKLRTGAGAVVI